MSYFVTCTHDQRKLNGTSSDTSLCHWGYLEKKIFPDVPDLPDVARSGQIWDVWEKIFFQKKKKFSQIWPDLGGPDLEIWPDLAASVSILPLQYFQERFSLSHNPSLFPLFLQKMMSPTEALEGLSRECRAAVVVMYNDRKSEIRKQFRIWGKTAPGVAGVAEEVWGTTLLQEVFNQRVWRMTAGLALPEARTMKMWKPDAMFAFIFSIVNSKECSETELEAMKRATPQLFGRPDSAEWVELMVLPFRRAVLTMFAKNLLERALSEIGEGVHTHTTPSETVSEHPEFKYALACSGKGSSNVEVNELLAIFDYFEAGCAQIAAESMVATAVLKSVTSLLDGVNIEVPTDCVSVYLASHLLHAYWHYVQKCVETDLGEDALQLETLCSNWVDASGPSDAMVNLGTQRLMCIAMSGYVPARIAYAARVAQGYAPESPSFVSRLTSAPKVVRITETERTVVSWLKEIIERADKQKYPIASYLLGVFALNNERRRKAVIQMLPPHRYFTMFLDLCEEAREGDAMGSIVPFERQSHGKGFPFLVGGVEEARRFAKAHTTPQVVPPVKPNHAEKLLAYCKANRTLFATYLVLFLIIAAQLVVKVR